VSAAAGPPALEIGGYLPLLAALAAASALVIFLIHRTVLSGLQPPPAAVARPWWWKTLCGAAWAAALLATCLAIPAALGSFAPAAAGYRLFSYPQAPVGLPNVGRVAALFLVQSLWEEMVFRAVAMGLAGLLLFHLLVKAGIERLRAWEVAGLFANAFQASLFAIVHRGNPAATPLSLLNIFLAGALLGALFWSQGALWGAWSFHFFWNFGLASAGLPVSGVTTTPALLPLGIRGAREDLLSGGRFGPEGSFLATVALAIAAGAVWRARRPRRGLPEE
jgi:membrane protease YdiL (CAAX protease family)